MKPAANQLTVPLIDLNEQHRCIAPEWQAALNDVVSQSQFILGPAVERFEVAFADYVGADHCVGLNNGTSALQLALHAADIGAGDEVITTPHTWISTTWAISYVGAKPVYVDIDPTTYTLDAALIEQAITSRTKAILPVHLYGQACDLGALTRIAEKHGLILIEDAAQAHGACYQGRRVGSFGQVGCFSFYPGKNLGAFGEAGGIVTKDKSLAARIRRLRDHAQDGRHHHVEVGYNARMEGIQGAVLEVKLRHLDEWNAARRAHAARLTACLKNAAEITTPKAIHEDGHVWHLYVVLIDDGIDRTRFMTQLADRGVSTAIHYPTLVPFQPAYAHLGYRRGQFPVAEDVARRCVSLPMFPEMTSEQIENVAKAVKGMHSAESTQLEISSRMKLQGKNVLVTGGAGFIGSHLVDQLADCCVRVLDDLSTGKEENLAAARARANVEFIRGDIRNRELVADLLEGTDVVFHLACRGVRHSIGNPLESHQVNAEGTLTLLQESRRAKVERFVHVSSSEVYGTSRYAPMDENHPTFPETVYGAAKLAGDAYARAYHQTYGLPTVVVRPFNNFGPRSHHEGDCGEVIPRFAVWALSGERPVIFGDGTQTRDFIFVEETAYWLCRAAECDALIGQTVNLGSGKETSVNELASLIYEEVGLGVRPPNYQPRRPGDVQRHLADVRRAQELLGFRTRIDVRSGIKRLISHLRSQARGVAALLGETTAVNWVPVGDYHA